MLSNYHSHTNYCDGSSHIEDYIIQAVNLGFDVYGFSSHAPLPFACKWSMPASQLKDYIRRIEYLQQKWKGEIAIYKSLEIDYIPEVMGPKHSSIQNIGLDYTIGSIHFLDAYADGTPWAVDDSHRKFLLGFEEIFKGDIKQVVKKYYSYTRRMVREETPTIIGHLDKIKMHNKFHPHFNENEDWYKNEVIKTLDTIKISGAFVEVNTRGIYKLKIEELYPSDWIIKEMISREIPIVLNSDSHTPFEINKGFDYAIQVLKDLGCNYVKNYNGSTWVNTPIEEVKAIKKDALLNAIEIKR